MHNIELDFNKKIINIELSGCLSLDEINSLYYKLEDLFGRFRTGEYGILIKLQRLDPISQEYTDDFTKVMELGLSWAYKLAVVHGNRTVTKMQMKRLEKHARKVVITETQIMRFTNQEEAMEYLLS